MVIATRERLPAFVERVWLHCLTLAFLAQKTGRGARALQFKRPVTGGRSITLELFIEIVKFPSTGFICENDFMSIVNVIKSLITARACELD